MSRFGSGPTLDEDWDFTIDGTGDIECTNQLGYEIAELEKDLAFAIGRRLDLELGKPTTPTQKATLESISRNVINRDPRIERIVDFDIEQMNLIESDGGRFVDGYTIETEVTGTEEPIDETLIIEV